MSTKQISRIGMVLAAGLVLAGCSKQDDVTGAGEINLAGCEVPAGTKRSEAEAITCDKTDPAVPAGAEEPFKEEVAKTKPDAEVIEAGIAELVKQSDGGTEYKEARKVLEGDLAADPLADAVVLYTLEGEGGANASTTYMAAFIRIEHELQLLGTTPVASWGQAVKDATLKDQAVQVTLLIQGPDDPDCCPSQEEKTQYVFHGAKWMRVQAQD